MLTGRRILWEGVPVGRTSQAGYSPPVCLYPYGPNGPTAAPGDIAQGRFGWINPADGTVTNTYVSGYPLGIILTQFSSWQLTYWRGRTLMLRAGKPTMLAWRGQYLLRFPMGATLGQPVWTNPADGNAYTFDGGSYIMTPWTAWQDAPAGGLAIVSTWQ